MFDTDSYLKTLKAAGFTEKQAQAQTKALLQALKDGLASQQDFDSFKKNIQQDLAKIEARLNQEPEINDENQQLINQLFKKALPYFIGQTALILYALTMIN